MKDNSKASLDDYKKDVLTKQLEDILKKGNIVDYNSVSDFRYHLFRLCAEMRKSPLFVRIAPYKNDKDGFVFVNEKTFLILVELLLFKFHAK